MNGPYRNRAIIHHAVRRGRFMNRPYEWSVGTRGNSSGFVSLLIPRPVGVFWGTGGWSFHDMWEARQGNFPERKDGIESRS